MLTFGAAHPFHARLDLPLTAAERRAAAAALVEPVCRHGVRRVLFVLYTADKEAAGSLCPHAGPGLRPAGHRRRRRAPQRRRTLVRGAPGPLRARGSRHPLRRHGTPVHRAGGGAPAGSPAARAASWPRRSPADAAGAASVARAIATAADRPAADAAEVLAVVTGLVADGRSPDPATAARILLALREPQARDAVLGAVDRHTAEAWLAAWSALVRVAPPPVLATGLLGARVRRVARRRRRAGLVRPRPGLPGRPALRVGRPGGSGARGSGAARDVVAPVTRSRTTLPPARHPP